MAKRQLLAGLTAVVILWPSFSSLQPTTATSLQSLGREFYAVFVQHDLLLSDPTYLLLTVSLINPSHACPVQVTITYMGLGLEKINLTLPADRIHKVTLNHSLILTTPDKSSKCVHIISDDDIFVYLASDYGSANINTKYGYMVLPTNALSSTYVVGTHCITNNCTLVVTSVEDDNDVTVTINLSPGGQAVYGSKMYVNDDSITEKLNRGESLQVICPVCDITGTLVKAKRQAAVVSGAVFTQFTASGRSLQDAAIEQMLPLETLGRRYFLGTSLAQADVIEYFKVVVLKSGTRFTVEWTSNTTTYTSTADRQVYQFQKPASDLAVLDSSDALMVVTLISNNNGTLNPDVSMTVVLPQELWGTSYQFYVPLYDPTDTVHLSLIFPFNVSAAHLNVTGASVSQVNKKGRTVENIKETSANPVSTEKRSYTLMWMSFATEGLGNISCFHDNCQPFWGFISQGAERRFLLFPLIQTQQAHRTTVSNCIKSSAASSTATAKAAMTSTTATTLPLASTLVDNPADKTTEESVRTVETLTTLPNADDTPTAANEAEITAQTTQEFVSITAEAATKPITSSVPSEMPTHSATGHPMTTYESPTNPPGTASEWTPLSTGTSVPSQATAEAATDEQRTTLGDRATTWAAHSSGTNTQTAADTSQRAGQGETTAAVSYNTTESSTIKLKQCRCRCAKNQPSTHPVTEEVRAELRQAAKRELAVNRKALSGYLRTKSCARDDRPASTVLGAALFLGVMISLVALLAMGDLLSLLRYWTETRSRKTASRKAATVQ